MNLGWVLLCSNPEFQLLLLVVAQAVEQWHFIRAGRVQIPGHTWSFQFRTAVNAFTLAGHWVFPKNSPSSLFLIIFNHSSPTMFKENAK